MFLEFITNPVIISVALMLILMLVVYWVVMALYLVLRPKQIAARGEAADQEQPYRSLFGNKREG